MNWKQLFFGVLLVIGVGVAGFLYRSFSERPQGPIACTADAKLCPDGTGLGRTGPTCTFPACPPPNIELPNVGIAFVLPEGYQAVEDYERGNPDLVAAYKKTDEGLESNLVIRRYAIATSTTAAAFIRENAIMDGSGLPAPSTAFSSISLGTSEFGIRRYSMVTLGRFEGVVDTVYYLEHGSIVYRFDALSVNVPDWTDPELDVLTLPANQDLRALLRTLQGE